MVIISVQEKSFIVNRIKSLARLFRKMHPEPAKDTLNAVTGKKCPDVRDMKFAPEGVNSTAAEYNRIAAELACRTCLNVMPVEGTPFDERIIDRGDYAVGFACNLANNAYIMAKGLHRRGINCKLFIETDFTDSYIMSQPAWEDQWFVGDDLPERNDILNGWRRPDYCIECRYKQELSSFAREFDYVEMNRRLSKIGIITNDPINYLKHHQIISHLEMLENMNNMDVLHVSGIMIGVASFLKKPYVTFPFGGDLYITPLEDNLRGWFQVQGFRRADMHIASGKLMADYLQRLGIRKNKIVLLPFMYDTEEYAPMSNNRLKIELHNAYPGKKIFFIGARQNWIWKGNDKLYRAISRIKNVKEKAVFITTWWGQDMNKSDLLINELGITETIVKIGIASKGALKHYIDAADVCIDQFTLGSLGTFSLESLSFAKPLLAYYSNDKHFEFAEVPPLFNVSTEDQIYETLNNIIDDKVDLADIGAEARKWINKYHSINALWPEYDRVYRMAIAQYNSRK